MADKPTVFVTVLGGVAEVDPDTVPKDISVEIVDLDSLKADKQYFLKLLPAARSYAKAQGYI